MDIRPRKLPERPGYTIVHVCDYEAGEPCRITTPLPSGRFSCRYVPTLWTRLRWTLARLFQ